MFAEMMIDQVARTLGRPAHEIREINMYREGDVTHFGQVRSLIHHTSPGSRAMLHVVPHCLSQL
jgi:CO/xanthine dehydrogenase Mo-binding subunit